MRTQVDDSKPFFTYFGVDSLDDNFVLRFTEV